MGGWWRRSRSLRARWEARRRSVRAVSVVAAALPARWAVAGRSRSRWRWCWRMGHGCLGLAGVAGWALDAWWVSRWISARRLRGVGSIAMDVVVVGGTALVDWDGRGRVGMGLKIGGSGFVVLLVGIGAVGVAGGPRSARLSGGWYGLLCRTGLSALEG